MKEVKGFKIRTTVQDGRINIYTLFFTDEPSSQTMRDDEAKRRTEEILLGLNLSGELNHSLVRLRSLFKDSCRSQTGFTYVELPMADKI